MAVGAHWAHVFNRINHSFFYGIAERVEVVYVDCAGERFARMFKRAPPTDDAGSAVVLQAGRSCSRVTFMSGLRHFNSSAFTVTDGLKNPTLDFEEVTGNETIGSFDAFTLGVDQRRDCPLFYELTFVRPRLKRNEHTIDLTRARPVTVHVTAPPNTRLRDIKPWLRSDLFFNRNPNVVVVRSGVVLQSFLSLAIAW